jgi:uncharacterized protein (TIGR03067 family)
MLTRPPAFLLAALLLVPSTVAADQDPETKQLQGRWEVIELAEDGKVIPKEAIREWLPSGGRFQIVENAIIFTSPSDGKKYVKVFSLDSTQYPKGIDLMTRDKKDGLGIYRFDNDRLVVCISDPTESKRPTEFSAKAGSKRMLMVLQRSTSQGQQPAPAKQQPSGKAGTVLTDAQVTEMLKSTWRYTDSIGALFATLNSNGTFSTVREVKEIRLFQKMFVQTPISTGTWTVQNGRLSFNVQTSVQWDRVNRQFDFLVRSISSRDLIFVDSFGRVGQAVKVK